MNTAASYISILHERYFRITLLLLLFAYPVSTFITDALQLQTNIISIASRAVQVLGVLLYTLFLLRYRLFKVYNSWLYVFLLFWVIYGIRVVHDTVTSGSTLGIEPNLYYLFGFVLSFLLSIPLFVAAPIDDVKLENWIYWIVFGCTLAILNSFMKIEVLFQYRVEANERLNPISAAYPSGILLVLAFRRLLHRKNYLWLHIPLNLMMIAIALFNLAIASTKSVYIFSFILIILMIGKLASSGKFIKFTIAFAVICVIAVLVLLYFPEYFTLSFSRFTEVDESSNDRLMYLNGATSQFFESPIWGSFIEEKTMKFYPHNPVLEGYMALGIVGGTIFLCYFLNYAVKTIQLMLQGPLTTITILSFATIVITLVSGSLSFSVEMWYFSAIFSAIPFAGKTIGSPHVPPATTYPIPLELHD